MSGLDPHEKPPEDLKTVFKHYQKLSLDDLISDGYSSYASGCLSGNTSSDPLVIRRINTAEICFDPGDRQRYQSSQVPVLEWSELPGLQFIPGLLSEEVQLQLLSRLLHRDLADPQHQTNLHKHYDLPYHLLKSDNSKADKSFFSTDPTSLEVLHPHDPSIHKPLSWLQFLQKKLRWLTLGGQYDWTAKKYPDQAPPQFPSDISRLVQKAFPEMVPEAAIVNVYSPGDTLALHRDVSEISANDLVSISIGCDAIFIAGLGSGIGSSTWRVFRLRSGDAVCMAGPSRYAWHGVAKIIKNTCPHGIQAWPGDVSSSNEFDAWRDWMADKRINLNIRQMFDHQEMCIKSALVDDSPS